MKRSNASALIYRVEQSHVADTRRRIDLVIRVNVNEIMNGMMMGVGIVQGGAQGRRSDGSRGRRMIDRLHRGYGRHLIGGTGRHLVHGIGRGHRAP